MSAVHTFAITCGFVWSLLESCYSFLTLCGVDESLGPRSLYPASSLGRVLFRHRSFPFQSNPCLLLLLVCKSANSFAMLFHCFCLTLVRPPLGLPYTFPLLSSHCPVLPLGLFLYYLGLSWPISSLWASSACFTFLGILDPFHYYIPIGFC